MNDHSLNVIRIVNLERLCVRLSVFSEESVPYFGPMIPTSREFTDHEELRHFLLVKRKSIAFRSGR